MCYLWWICGYSHELNVDKYLQCFQTFQWKYFPMFNLHNLYVSTAQISKLLLKQTETKTGNSHLKVKTTAFVVLCVLFIFQWKCYLFNAILLRLSDSSTWTWELLSFTAIDVCKVCTAVWPLNLTSPSVTLLTRQVCPSSNDQNQPPGAGLERKCTYFQKIPVNTIYQEKGGRCELKDCFGDG